MITNTERIGHFTSSEIYRLIGGSSRAKKQAENGFPDVVMTYIIEKIEERNLGRSLGTETTANALKWGKCLEAYAHKKVNTSFEYSLIGDETTRHNKIDCWSGSVDVLKIDTAGDIKCPYTLKSFVSLIRPLYLGFNGMDAINMLRNGFEHNGIKYEKHKDAEKYYWQIVSNACIHSKQFGELIVYMPYQDDLESIKEDLNGEPDYYFLTFAKDEDLPYLPKESKYNDINVIRFEILQEDKDLLTEKVKLASELLTKF